MIAPRCQFGKERLSAKKVPYTPGSASAILDSTRKFAENLQKEEE